MKIGSQLDSSKERADKFMDESSSDLENLRVCVNKIPSGGISFLYQKG